ncbi:MAG: hypothetical protein Q8Q08_02395 [Candidatus Omnitrophota bacterium]|nr:hypothetical protein [Candidatus Omnitrophota bacterium]MDZ4243001.1 hypothetical protein [Candidatus Omnitrophota bacterium]
MIEPKKMVIFFVILIVGVNILKEKMFDESVHRGGWYTVVKPVGWNERKEENEIIFESPETSVMTGMPEAIFSIYSVKATGALFLEDLFGEVMASLRQLKGKVLDKGQLKIDNQDARWVLFFHRDPDLFILTFYIADDFNRLTKIQFISTPEKFPSYRSQFEAFKNSIRFKKII